jgi:hypothetical protein
MSKVVTAISATRGDRHRTVQTGKSQLFQDVFSAREIIHTDPIYAQTQYRIGVTLGSECWVSETNQLINGESALELAIQRTKRQVIEAIFGEFRVDFRNIQRAIYDNNMEEANVLLDAMEKKMFEVTEEDIREHKGT